MRKEWLVRDAELFSDCGGPYLTPSVASIANCSDTEDIWEEIGSDGTVTTTSKEQDEEKSKSDDGSPPKKMKAEQAAEKSSEPAAPKASKKAAGTQNIMSFFAKK